MNIETMARSVKANLMPYICKLPDLPVAEIKEILGKETVYKLSFNENPLGPSPGAKEAMKKAIEHLNLYPSSDGIELRKTLAIREGIETDQIILSNGADEMIVLIAQTFLEPEDEVIIPAVTFVQYLASTHLMGARPVITPMSEDLDIELDAILQNITERTKLIFLCNPNNPTGKIIPREKLGHFLDQVPEHILVVIDEAYHEYVESPEYSSAVAFVKPDKAVFVVRTFSKIYSLAAVRIGYGIGPVEIIDAINHVRPPFNVNGVAQAGALASLADERQIAEARAINQRGKELLYQAFAELGLSYCKSDGNFVFVDTGRDSLEMFDSLADHGIIVRTLKGYGLETALRISVGTEKEVNALVDALKTILAGSR